MWDYQPVMIYSGTDSLMEQLLNENITQSDNVQAMFERWSE